MWLKLTCARMGDGFVQAAGDILEIGDTTEAERMIGAGIALAVPASGAEAATIQAKENAMRPRPRMRGGVA